MESDDSDSQETLSELCQRADSEQDFEKLLGLASKIQSNGRKYKLRECVVGCSAVDDAPKGSDSYVEPHDHWKERSCQIRSAGSNCILTTSTNPRVLHKAIRLEVGRHA
jgi:hypothetical protein